MMKAIRTAKIPITRMSNRLNNLQMTAMPFVLVVARTLIMKNPVTLMMKTAITLTKKKNTLMKMTQRILTGMKSTVTNSKVSIKLITNKF